MSKRSKACDITMQVKKTVWERDRGKCIICGSSNSAPNSHYIRRSQGGLGIEENIGTMCTKCHEEYDNGMGNYREAIAEAFKDYLMIKYPNWNEEDLIYDKFKWVKKK